MEIGRKLKEARVQAGFTQEQVAEAIQVTRQTMSNWETEKSYPDIISVIRLSDLYQLSLDELLKGDINMMKHLEESTNVVSSNKKLIGAISINVLVIILLILFNGIIEKNQILLVMSLSGAIVATTFLFYQIIKKF